MRGPFHQWRRGVEGRRIRQRRYGRPYGRGVSDVIATILLLALTVTLFASIFAFVGAFPQPTPQAQNEFQSALVVAANGTFVTGITITHLAGPVISPYDHVLFASSRVQSAWQFNIGGQGIPVSWGLGNGSTGWSLGQVWSTTFTKLVKIPDNITVYVVTPTQLLYSATLPAITQNIPPAIQAVGTSPTSLTIGEAFQVWATLAGNLTGITVTVNLNGVPGLSGLKTMVNDSYVWVYNVTGSTTTAGTYYAFVTVTAASLQTVSQSVPIVIASSGGSTTSSLSVTTGVSPQPFSTNKTFGVNLLPWATITYTGTKSGSAYANFTIIQAEGGKAATASIVKTSITSTTPISISGPTSVTDYSSTPFVTWMNTTVTVYANVSVPGIGSATGTSIFGPYNFAIGYAYFTTSSSGATSGNTTTAAHTCTTSSCPYLDLQFKNNFLTSTYNAPASLTFNYWVNWTCKKTGGSACTTASGSNPSTGKYSYSVASGATPILSYLNSTTLTTRWAIPTSDNVDGNVFTYLLTVLVTSGTVTVGYIWDQAILTFTT